MDDDLRVATRDDIDGLMRLRALMFEAMGTPADALAAPEWRAEARSWFAENLTDDRARILVVEDDGDIVSGGVAEVVPAIPSPSTPHGRLGFISNIATLPHARGRGLARAVMTELVRWLDEDTDAERIDLAATADGAVIYRSMGFTESEFPTMRRPGSRHAR